MNDASAFRKRRVLLDLLDKGMVMLHLDPRGEDVIVPTYLKSEPTLRLNIAYGFRLPALDITAEGVYAVLSFNRQNFGCTLPWRAIYGMTLPEEGHRGEIWQESIPPELLQPRPQPAQPPVAPSAPAAEARPKPVMRLRPVAAAPEDSSAEDADTPQTSSETSTPAPSADEAPSAETPKKRPHLTLVKN